MHVYPDCLECENLLKEKEKEIEQLTLVKEKLQSDYQELYQAYKSLKIDLKKVKIDNEIENEDLLFEYKIMKKKISKLENSNQSDKSFYQRQLIIKNDEIKKLSDNLNDLNWHDKTIVVNHEVKIKELTIELEKLKKENTRIEKKINFDSKDETKYRILKEIKKSVSKDYFSTKKREKLNKLFGFDEDINTK